MIARLHLLLSLLSSLLTTTTFAKRTPLSLQWAICDTDPSTVLQKLYYPPHPPPHKIQNITYFDLSPPNYTAHGLGLRTKLHKHVPISLVKVRFHNKTDVPDELAECKWDRYGNMSLFTCGVPSPLVEGQPVWSDAQIKFATRYHPEIQWDRLVPYGPFLNPKWKIRIKDRIAVFDSVEVVLPLSGKKVHLMEVEIGIKGKKVKKGDKYYRKFTKHLEKRGVVICEEPQLPKTLRLFEALAKDNEERKEEMMFGEVQQRLLS